MADIDLTGTDSTADVNGLIFDWVEGENAGTGGFGTFLSIQNTGTEDGFNTSPRALNDTTHTFDVPFSALSTQTVGGVAYYEFRLDLNEANSGANPLIQLEELKFYTSSRPAVATDYTNGSLGADFHLAYD